MLVLKGRSVLQTQSAVIVWKLRDKNTTKVYLGRRLQIQATHLKTSILSGHKSI